MFEIGPIKSHSGLKLDWKINCDTLSDRDWECIAAIIATHYKFLSVHGVPTGGQRLADALMPYTGFGRKALIQTGVLIVDDVMTTGKSMEEARKQFLGLGYPSDQIHGVVLFDRSTRSTGPWIKQFFTLNTRFEHAGYKA